MKIDTLIVKGLEAKNNPQIRREMHLKSFLPNLKTANTHLL